jgi:hypothetical protein
LSSGQVRQRCGGRCNILAYNRTQGASTPQRQTRARPASPSLLARLPPGDAGCACSKRDGSAGQARGRRRKRGSASRHASECAAPPHPQRHTRARPAYPSLFARLPPSDAGCTCLKRDGSAGQARGRRRRRGSASRHASGCAAPPHPQRHTRARPAYPSLFARLLSGDVGCASSKRDGSAGQACGRRRRWGSASPNVTGCAAPLHPQSGQSR